MPGTFSPPPRVSDPDMHHGTCVTHVPGCMPGSLTTSFIWSRRQGKTLQAFPAHAQPAILRIWQEGHWVDPQTIWNDVISGQWSKLGFLCRQRYQLCQDLEDRKWWSVETVSRDGNTFDCIWQATRHPKPTSSGMFRQTSHLQTVSL